MRTEMGGFQWAANKLTEISGRRYSRQAVQGLWMRRLKTSNGFPELHQFTINGHDHDYFLLDEVKEWWITHHGIHHHGPDMLRNPG